jgi:hypothetical protein
VLEVGSVEFEDSTCALWDRATRIYLSAGIFIVAIILTSHRDATRDCRLSD